MLADQDIAIFAGFHQLQQDFIELVVLKLLTKNIDSSPETVQTLRQCLSVKISPNVRASSDYQSSVQIVLEKSKTVREILTCLFEKGLIGYLNFDLLKSCCCHFVSGLKELVDDYETEFKFFFKTKLLKLDLLALIRVFKDDQLKPSGFVNVGLPYTFGFVIEKNESAFAYVSLKDLLNDNFPTWSKDAMIVDVLTGSVIVEFAVLPISAVAVVRDLTSEKVLLMLKEKGVTDVRLSDDLLYIGRRGK